MKKIAGIFGSFVVLLATLIFSMPATAQKGADLGPDMTMDAKAKAEIVNALVKALKTRYVIPDVGDKTAQALEEHQAHGDYNSVTSAKEFAQLLSKQLSDVAHDRHMGVGYSSSVIPPSPEPGTEPAPGGRGGHDQERQEIKKDNFGFERVERLPGNIGYLKINGFVAAPDPEGAAKVVTASLGFLANTDALIIDVRPAGGGEPVMVDLLASYFFGDKAVHLNDIVYRKIGTKEYAPPQEEWTSTKISGPRYLDKPVYILTSHHTFSGAEAFTYDMQAQKRATIVGEVTGGGGNLVGPVRLGDHFSASIPYGHAVNPITHTNWEGVGIKPDIEASRADALKVAQKAALEYLITKTANEHQLADLKQALNKLESQPATQ